MITLRAMFVFEFLKVTFAPATTAPDGSLTVPVMSAVACCACAPAACNAMQMARERIHDANCLEEMPLEIHCDVIGAPGNVTQEAEKTDQGSDSH